MLILGQNGDVMVNVERIHTITICPRYEADGSLMVTEVNPCKSE